MTSTSDTMQGSTGTRTGLTASDTHMALLNPATERLITEHEGVVQNLLIHNIGVLCRYG